MIFDVEKLEKFDDRYSDSYLKGDNVKIEVKLKTETEDETGDSGDFGDFLGVRSIILDTNNNQKNTGTFTDYNLLASIEDKVESNHYFNNDIHIFQKSQESQESQESPVDNNDLHRGEIPDINNEVDKFLSTNRMDKVGKQEELELYVDDEEEDLT